MAAARQFVVKIAFANAAFGSSVIERDAELARMLREVADRLDGGDEATCAPPIVGSIRLLDINGNAVGYATFE
jgi:hypothetical protein